MKAREPSSEFRRQIETIDLNTHRKSNLENEEAKHALAKMRSKG